MSVSLLIAELQLEDFNPILLYKPQGEKRTEYPSLSLESFVLVIQTQFQQNMFQSNGHKILCIDATHGTNAYRFQLITCIVPDEFGKGTFIDHFHHSSNHHGNQGNQLLGVLLIVFLEKLWEPF